MAESELFDLMPNMNWNFWAPLCHDLLDRHVLMYRAGTLIFAHEQVSCVYLLGISSKLGVFVECIKYVGCIHWEYQVSWVYLLGVISMLDIFIGCVK